MKSPHEAFIIASPLSPAEVSVKLGEYSKEWRESKLPDSVRRDLVFSCRIDVGAETFRLRLGPRRRGPQLVWIGAVSPTEHGSRIAVHSEQTAFSRGVSAVPFAVWVGFALWAGARFFILFALGLFAAFTLLSLAHVSGRERKWVEAILKAAIQGSIVPTGDRFAIAPGIDPKVARDAMGMLEDSRFFSVLPPGPDRVARIVAEVPEGTLVRDAHPKWLPDALDRPGQLPGFPRRANDEKVPAEIVRVEVQAGENFVSVLFSMRRRSIWDARLERVR